MHWSPEPFPDMSQAEYDDLARQMRAAGNCWPADMPPIIVDHESQLIDGYKRRQVAADLGITTCPAIVLKTEEMSDEERREKYEALRLAVNSHTLLIDEIEAWLREARN